MRPVLYALIYLLGVIALPSAGQAANQYDVSYVWSNKLDSVRDYRERVLRVLGPGVSKGLKLVSSGDLYGVVYVRHGDSNGATRVARVHSGLLRAGGLDAAAPLISRDWTFVDDADDAQVSFASVTPASVPQTRSIPRVESVPRVHNPVRLQSVPKIQGASTVHKTPRVQNAPRTNRTVAERAHELRDIGAAVEAYIKLLRRQGKLESDERTSWSVYDFTTGEKLVNINEDVQLQAASLVKPFIAAAFLHKVRNGDLIYGSRSRRHMEKMIQRSNNWSTNWVMRQVGGPQAVERILKQEYPGIFRDMQLVEYIPANGRAYRNKASAHDYSRFLYALWNGKIEGSREIKRLMALPGGDRIYMGAKNIPKGTEVYNKTGSTARVCGDMGILNIKGPDGKRYPYTIIGIIEKQQRASNYTSWIRARSDVIRHVSSIVYEGITQHHKI